MITGECFCGEVTYQYTDTLSDARSCHCSRCRKAFNAQASAIALVEADKFNWLTGEHQLTSYAGKDGYGYQFCNKCGSTLSLINNGTVMGITLGCLNGDPPVTLQRHIHVGSKARWEIIPEGVPQFEKGP